MMYVLFYELRIANYAHLIFFLFSKFILPKGGIKRGEGGGRRVFFCLLTQTIIFRQNFDLVCI